MATHEITIKGIEFPNAGEAIQHTYADGRGEAITIGGKYMVVEKAEAERLAAAGVYFAYLGLHEMPDGSTRIVTIPIN
jgi:hypothetical protein